MTRSIYSTYEAKARFSEILRQVRAGNSVLITYRGDEVAEIRPIARDETVEARLERLERKGIVTSTPDARKASPETLRPLGKKPGALKRFLESRD